MASFVERPRTTCALGGALAAMSALPRVIPVVHSAIGCGGNLSGITAFGAGYFGSGYCSGSSVPTSAITETEIVFGGNDRLAEELQSTLELMDGDLYVVATGCMTEMIGDDVQGVVSEFAAEGKPVLAISTPSFKGDAYSGYEILLTGIFNRYLPKAKKKNPQLINLFGIVPALDPFFRGDLTAVKTLIEKLGYQVNTFFTPDQTFENIKSAPEAILNIQLSQVWGTDFVEQFEQRHDTPYWVTDLPIGPAATDDFLYNLARRLAIPQPQIEALVKAENRLYYGYFTRTADVFADSDFKFHGVTVSNSNYAIPVSAYIQRELGWVQLDIYVTDQLNEEQKSQLKSRFEDSGLAGRLIFETDTSQIGKSLTQSYFQSHGEEYRPSLSPLYIIGSTLEKDLASQLGGQILPVSYPVYNRTILDRGYAGYQGGLHLFEDLISVLVSQK